MADRKITDLTALAAGSQATGDLLTIVDVSEAAATDKNKKITVESLFKGIPGDVGIGTSSPSKKLEISASSAEAGIALSSSGRTLVMTSHEQAGVSQATKIGTTSNHELRIITNNTERMRIDSSGNVGIGHTSPASLFTVGGDVITTAKPTVSIAPSSGNGSITLRGGSPTLSFDQTGGGDGTIIYDSGSDLLFKNGTLDSSTEQMRIDSSGRLLVGTSSGNDSGSESNLIIESNSSGGSSYGGLMLRRGSTSIGSGSSLGRMYFADQNGNTGARISALGDGTWATDDYPGVLIFDTTADAGSSPTERVRIDSDGHVKYSGNSSSAWMLSPASDVSSYSQLDAHFPASNRTLFFNENTSNDSYVVWNRNSGSSGKGFGLQGQNFKVVQGSSEQLRIDSSGRVGIGTTSPGRKLEVNSGTDDVVINAVSSDSGSYISFEDNSTTGDTHVRVGAIGNALRFDSGNSESARIDSSGRLLVGATSTSANAVALFAGNPSGNYTPLFLSAKTASIGTNDNFANISFTDSGHTVAAQIAAGRDGGTWTSGSSQPTKLTFHTTANGASSTTERVRITNVGSCGHFATNETVIGANSNAASGTTYRLFSGAYNATGVFTGVESVRIWTNGNVENANNSYSQLSDVKLKENIVDANSQWDDLKAIQIRNWNFKAETGYETHTQIGVVAQEIETVSPGLVYETPDRDDEGNDLGTVTKSVNYSVLYVKAVKALQEAMDRIETLETSNADLLARVTALEAG